MRHALRRIVHGVSNRRSRRCYGQNGEDLVLDRLLDRQPTGFFVDIGAHHPMRFSNSYLFYRRGWTGINVDAEPGAMTPFRRWRPRDINIEAGVGSRPGQMTYFRFNEPALNTFSPEEAALKDAHPYRIIERIEVQMRRLEDILASHTRPNQVIDFMSIDVEGMEIDVLSSSDWDRFRPRFVLAETLRTSVLRLESNEIVQWMQAVGYEPVTQAYNTTFFEDARRANADTPERI